MRRKDREVKSQTQIDEIIKACSCLRLGFSDKGFVYIVPLNFGYTNKEGKRTFYFHSAKEGRKVNLIKDNLEVGFEGDCQVSIKTSDKACGYACYYKSIMGNGRLTILDSVEDKCFAMNQIMAQVSSKDSWKIDPKLIENTLLFKLEVECISAKAHLE